MASDSKRVAMGLHRKSSTMVDRFAQEGCKRKSELEISKLPIYLQKLVNNLEFAVKDSDSALMYSTLFQNYVILP